MVLAAFALSEDTPAQVVQLKEFSAAVDAWIGIF
jgi:hypothetical protein